ncbi:hypothetical protein [Clostridium intestinale]|uniref:hypothetical protein n=1 Tax=Clostridium intestinale TaxID=36845 RepID=UPI002DD6A614|nr:hypothetical protein [Clostridium intestinale]WRY50608.1 hypothetical protein P8F83_18255 [Clostridium intestinale]
MNIFDVGGLTTFIAVVATILGGTVIFMLLHKIFDIIHFGFGAMASMWFVCCIVAAFIVNFLGGIVGGIFSVIWFLIKVGAIIAIIVTIGKFIYGNLNSKKE